MTEHIDIEMLADHAEGLLNEEESARVAGHLTECERCAEGYAALGDVSAVLSALPAPAMPPDVAMRIEAAIAAEAGARQHETPEGDQAEATVVPFRSRRPRWIAPLTAAAAAVIVVGGGFAIVKQMGAGNESGSSAPNPATSQPSQALPVISDPDYLHSKTKYTSSALESQVNTVVKRSKAGSNEFGPKASRESRPASPMPSDVAGCVSHIGTKSGGRPILVDRATYNGQAVKVLVFRKATDANAYDVWIVDSRCSSSTDGVVTHTTVTRHS